MVLGKEAAWRAVEYRTLAPLPHAAPAATCAACHGVPSLLRQFRCRLALEGLLGRIPVDETRRESSAGWFVGKIPWWRLPGPMIPSVSLRRHQQIGKWGSGLTGISSLHSGQIVTGTRYQWFTQQPWLFQLGSGFSGWTFHAVLSALEVTTLVEVTSCANGGRVGVGRVGLGAAGQVERGAFLCG